jgi:hypothetical protein
MKPSFSYVGVGSSRLDAGVLAPAVDGRNVPLHIFGVEPHAPAAAEDAVVALHERRERGPGRFVESLDRVAVQAREM